MKAVWLIRLRELASRMRFWTTLVGYNPHDRSLSQGIYLIYVAVFFSLWGFAVLALLANLGAGVLSLFKGSSPSMASVIIIVVILLIDAIVRAYYAGITSPFIFSDIDAELICQTPVDRRQVALAWYLVDWLSVGLAFSVLAVILRFSILQLVEPGGIMWAHIPSYILNGLQVMIIIQSLNMALMVLDYALGAWRLRGDKDYLWLRWIPVGVTVILITMVFVARRGIEILLWPLLFPLQAGFGEGDWLLGFCLAFILAIGCTLVLYWASLRLNLSRAAQESRFRWEAQQFSWLGDTRVSQQMKIRKRLGLGHKASRIQGRAGYFAVIWKDWVTTLRAMNFGSIVGWLSIFGVYLGIILLPDWGSRLWAFIIWCLLLGQRSTSRLRDDLEVWVITRQLPLPVGEILVAEVATPILGATLLSWLAFGISTWLGLSPNLSLLFLAPMAIISIVLAAELDILRQCHSSDLLEGKVAEFGAGGLVIGIVSVAIPLISVSWLTSQFKPNVTSWLALLLGLILSLGIIFVLWRLAVAVFQNIK